MPKNPTFYENAGDDKPKRESHSPSPSEWLGTGRRKFGTKSPTFSEDHEQGPVLTPAPRNEGWRQFFKGTMPRDPLWNPLLPPETKEEAIKFKNEAGDSRQMIFVLEQAAEVLEAAGHIDLAAECETLCELLCLEN